MSEQSKPVPADQEAGPEAAHQVLLGECVTYFRQNKSLHRTLGLLKEKWKSLGRASGFIRILSLKPEEHEALERFLGLDLPQCTATIKVARFQEALDSSRFRGVTLPELLEAYFQETLTTNKTDHEQRRQAITACVKRAQESLNAELEKLLFTAPASGQAAEPDMAPVFGFLTWLGEEKKGGYQTFLKEYNQNPDGAELLLVNVGKALGLALAKTTASPATVALARLAAEATGNPHALDRGTTLGTLFLYGLGYLAGAELPKSAEEEGKLLLRFQITKDDLSSFTAFCGIELYEQGQPHPAYHSFAQRREPCLAALRNLLSVDRADCGGKVVFAVENQMVFSELCRRLAETNRIVWPGLLCTSGQLKTASLILVDLLLKSGCTIYYAGDFDPEGLLIADNMLKRNRFADGSAALGAEQEADRAIDQAGEPRGQVRLWRYTPEDYQRCCSQEKISRERLKKVERLEDPTLKALGQLLHRTAFAGYQELLMEQMLEDMSHLF